MSELYELIILLLFTALVYWQVGDVNKLLVLVAACSAYLLYQDYVSFLIISSVTAVTYYLLKRRRKSDIPIFISLLLSVALFIVFKWKSTLTDGVYSTALPLGMSFYLFRLIHFCIEAFKRNVSNFTLQDFIGYLFFLPVILIGPIIRFPDWKKEFKRNRWDPMIISNGLERMLYGLFKVVVLGNYLISTKLNTYLQVMDHQSWTFNYLDCFRYAANSYFLFAGYSDIAVGSAMLFGMRIMENFKYPFIARNINDFWNRWHISLSSWCRDYVFMPVVSYTRIYWLAILASMLVLGLWHEFSSRYILWAFFHVIGIWIWYLYNQYVGSKITKNITLYEIISWFVTINFVIISFVFLKEKDLQQSFDALSIILGLNR